MNLETLFDLPPAVHRTDPASSFRAEAAVKNVRKSNMRLILGLIENNPKRTRGELARLMACETGKDVTRCYFEVCRRVNDLAVKGYVKIGPERQCQEGHGLVGTVEFVKRM